MTTWIEVSSGKDQHGGRGWEFGTCLWSPTKTRLGQTRNYRIMSEPQKDEYVINCQGGMIKGTSCIASPCRIVNDAPPMPGSWGYSREFFRIELAGYTPFSNPIALRDLVAAHFATIRQDIATNRPTYYLFSLYPTSAHYPQGRIHVAQGRFLAKSTPTLSSCIYQMLSAGDREHESVTAAIGSKCSSIRAR